MSQFYHYFYFFLFFIGIFIIILIVCYGKRTKKSATWSWDDLHDAFTSFRKKPTTVPKKHEQRCRIIMENLFKAPFPSIRPDFLKYTSGKNLELDGYNEQLGIAFEYQGIQHRTFTPRFHKTKEDFKKQVQRDIYKKKICEDRGIRLLEIPDTVPYDDLQEYIISEVKKWYEEK